ncbi:MAG: hypothetical protein R3Y64_09780 [Peptostreptococcaceae bacterium]
MLRKIKEILNKRKNDKFIEYLEGLGHSNIIAKHIVELKNEGKYYTPLLNGFEEFTFEQLLQVYDALKNDVYDKEYYIPKYHYRQMYQITCALKENVDVDKIINLKVNDSRVWKEVVNGLIENIDLTKYANEGYDEYQLKEIGLSIRDNINLDYLNKSYKGFHIKHIRETLLLKKDIVPLLNPKFNEQQTKVISRCLSLGIDVKVLSDSRCDVRQMFEIIQGIKSNLNISVYLDYAIPSETMGEIRESLMNKTFKRSDYFEFNEEENRFVIKDEFRKNM